MESFFAFFQDVSLRKGSYGEDYLFSITYSPPLKTRRLVMVIRMLHKFGGNPNTVSIRWEVDKVNIRSERNKHVGRSRSRFRSRSLHPFNFFGMAIVIFARIVKEVSSTWDNPSFSLPLAFRNFLELSGVWGDGSMFDCSSLFRFFSFLIFLLSTHRRDSTLRWYRDGRLRLGRENLLTSSMPRPRTVPNRV